MALIRGDTLTGIWIRHATLMGYIKQALALHTDRGLPNPRLADIDYIKIMSNAVKKYESVPKRQEMISDGMFHFIARLTKRASKDSFIRAVADWIILGAYTGFRKSEWCNGHPVDFEKITDPQWGTRATSLAIIAEDFSFATSTGSCLDDINNISPTATSLSLPCASANKRTMTMVNCSLTSVAPLQPGCAPLKRA